MIGDIFYTVLIVCYGAGCAIMPLPESNHINQVERVTNMLAQMMIGFLALCALLCVVVCVVLLWFS